MTDPLVSVVIPTYNRRDFILDAVKSVFSQTYPNWELLVVDDGSTDGTERLLQKYIPPVLFFRQGNRGPGAARNLGIRESHGDYIAFLDSDDRWLPDKVQRQIELVRSFPNVGLVGCGENCISEGGEVFFRGRAPPTVSLNALKIRCTAFGGASRALVPRAVLEDVGVFDESLKVNQDWDLWLRIAKKYEVRNVEEPLTEWRRHFQPRPDRDLSTRLENTYRLIRRHVEEPTTQRKALSWLHYELAQLLLHVDRRRLRSMKHLALSYRYSPRRVTGIQNRRLLLVEYVLPADFIDLLVRLKNGLRAGS